VNAAMAVADSRRAELAAIRDALVDWVSLPQGGDRRLAEAWHAQLRDGGMLWAACGEHVPRLLSERLACVVDLAKRWDMAPAPQAPHCSGSGWNAHAASASTGRRRTRLAGMPCWRTCQGAGTLCLTL